MDQEKVANIVAEAIKAAISELPTKDHMKDFLTALEVKINETICEQIQKATDPLHAKIEQLELKHYVYEAHFAALEHRLNIIEQRSDDAEQYSRRSCLRIYGIPLPKKSHEDASDCMKKVKKSIQGSFALSYTVLNDLLSFRFDSDSLYSHMDI